VALLLSRAPSRRLSPAECLGAAQRVGAPAGHGVTGRTEVSQLTAESHVPNGDSICFSKDGVSGSVCPLGPLLQGLCGLCGASVCSAAPGTNARRGCRHRSV